LYRLDRVTGARGVKAARWPKQRANQVSVTFKQQDYDFLHRLSTRLQCSSKLWIMSLFVTRLAFGRAMATTSSPTIFNAWWRNDSLTKRFIRLRRTARKETLRDTVIPSLACSVSLRRA
jgi:hypothetical protein